MRIYIPNDISYQPDTGNSYLPNLVSALNLQSSDVTVVTGSNLVMNLHDHSFDIINIHWPEYLALSDNDVNAIPAFIATNKKDAKLVLTVHNLVPHKKTSADYINLYKELISLTDGFIHFSESSKNIFIKVYNSSIQSHASHEVIYHGNYSNLPNTVSKQDARAALQLPPKIRKVFLSFGEHRSYKELSLLIKGFLGSGFRGENYLMIVGRLPLKPAGNPLRYLVLLVLKLCQYLYNIRILRARVNDADVQKYFNAADVIIVPRMGSLNSGNVYLGMTFGKALLLPDYGTYEELGRKTGNFIYKNGDASSLSEQMNHITNLANNSFTILCKNNKKFSTDQLGWSNIAAKHLKFYNSIIPRKS